MTDMTLEAVFAQAKQLSPQDRLRLLERLAATLHNDLKPPSDWHRSLDETYGILHDDPIERPPQLPLEERDPIE